MGVPGKRKLIGREQKNKNKDKIKEKDAKKKKSKLMLQDDAEETQRETFSLRGDESYEEEEKYETEEDDEDEEEEASSSSESEQDTGDLEKGATKLVQGSRAFKMAFTKIMKKSSHEDSVLGPVLSAHKKLVVKKLAEELEDTKTKGDARKAKNLAGDKGHVTPASFLDSKEKFLISVATKGVVKLFNAVNKAQNPLKRINPSREKDAKVLMKKRRETFNSEMKKTTTAESTNPNRVLKAADSEDEGEPGWAPLRDSYMLTSSKVKDWDKMELQQSSAHAADAGNSSDED